LKIHRPQSDTYSQVQARRPLEIQQTPSFFWKGDDLLFLRIG